MEMNDAEKQLFSTTYTNVFVELQLERLRKHGNKLFLDQLYAGSRAYGDEEVASVAAEVAKGTVTALRAALVAQAAAVSPSPSGPTGGFEHL